ncbi:helix-turn-helix domain-containing protein [Persicitalea jodogahamensis]|uniref:helix-turn-helix domain-containing protein n=1 Tax=Persicitalea jodogahamensis TaxID=402147 RepID=UPI0021D13A76|nr:winged helix-turn-helix domain-containing protein [Persicitalea jodogahamensis]
MTRQRVNSLIERIFDVSYDPTQVGLILKKLGWSLQKPVKKARQQDKQKVEHCRDEVLPGQKKS